MLFFELALEDLRQAADLFVLFMIKPMAWMDGSLWRCRPCSLAKRLPRWTRLWLLHKRAERPNLFIKIPGTSEGLPAIEEAIFRGVPVNVTLLFSARAISRLGESLSARH